MDNTIFTVLKLLGSLALLMYGMIVMSEGLQKLTGDYSLNILDTMTTNRFSGLLTLKHDNINPSYNIKNEIKNYRNLLEQHNVEEINNKACRHQDGVYYMDIVNEAEKLGDYVLNVVQAVVEKKI